MVVLGIPESLDNSESLIEKPFLRTSSPKSLHGNGVLFFLFMRHSFGFLSSSFFGIGLRIESNPPSF